MTWGAGKLFLQSCLRAWFKKSPRIFKQEINVPLRLEFMISPHRNFRSKSHSPPDAISASKLRISSPLSIFFVFHSGRGCLRHLLSSSVGVVNRRPIGVRLFKGQIFRAFFVRLESRGREGRRGRYRNVCQNVPSESESEEWGAGSNNLNMRDSCPFIRR